MRSDAVARMKTQDAVDNMWGGHKVDCGGETLDSRFTDGTMSSINQGVLCM
jgi:hypothetical protein